MRTIAIGDIHGCYEEFLRLLTKINYDSSSDEIISLGDLVEKGPMNELVVSWFRRASANPKMKVFAVKGNHDEALARFWKHETKVHEGIQTKNPMKASEDRVRTYEDLSEESLRYLDSLPLFLEREVEGRKFLFIHGGIFPKIAPEKMDKKVICRLRYLRWNNDKEKYKMVQAGKERDGDQFWADVYDGSFGFAFYGHQPYSGKPRPHKHAMGLDTSCVYGENLSAAVVDGSGIKIFQVPAKKQYSEVWKYEG